MKWPHRMLKEYLKARVREYVLSIRAEITEPRFVKGYQNPGGPFRARTRVASTAILFRPEGISIGENVFIGHNALLDGSGGLSIEEGCQIGSDVSIYTHSSHMSLRLLGRHYTEVPEEKKAGFVKLPVRIGRYTGVGFGAGIRAGVTVGKGCMIHPMAFINTDIPDFSVVRLDGTVAGDSRAYDRMFVKDDEQLRRWVEEWQEEENPA